MPLKVEQIQRIAGFEINALRAAEVFGEEYEKVSIPARGTPVYDVNGSVLFHRLSLTRGRTPCGYADIAVEDALAEPLLATAIGAVWDEPALVEAGTVAARMLKRGLKHNAVRFVAYSYPKLALQFLLNGTEVLMLELHTWAEVPPAKAERSEAFQPSNFERWSLLGTMPPAERERRAAGFRRRIALWNAQEFKGIDLQTVTKEALRLKKFILRLVDTREIHYSKRSTDHHPCYELRGQQTNVWCVAASVEMVLNFYRYGYDQIRLALELGLGTLDHPNGLPYANVGDVVTVMENLTSNALDVTMHTNPGWTVFRDEIRANRPLISFIPGHSRSVAGYTHTLLALPGLVPFRGLLVYDPWPPTTGVITRWENFATQTYQYAYSSVLQEI